MIHVKHEVTDMAEALNLVESLEADIVLVREKRNFHKILVRIPVVADRLREESPYKPVGLLRGNWVFSYKSDRRKTGVMKVLLNVFGRDRIKYVGEV